jgi:hypothetical protein
MMLCPTTWDPGTIEPSKVMSQNKSFLISVISVRYFDHSDEKIMWARKVEWQIRGQKTEILNFEFQNRF